jgi:hypothetical protein
MRTAWVLAWDLISFASAAMLLRLPLFPLMMSAIAVFGMTLALLWVKWFLAGGAGPAAPPGSLHDSVQNIQNAALGLGYRKLETWAQDQLKHGRYRAGLAYQVVLVLICLGLRVMDALQGGWLYMLFGLGWQAGLTGFLYWRIDRRGSSASTPPGAGVGPSSGVERGLGVSVTGISMRPPFTNLSSGVPGARPPGTRSAVGQPGPQPGAQPARPRTRFAFRSDVQAVIGFSAGMWCGVFSRHFGWWYGFTSVMAFRTLLRLASPMAFGLIGRWLPSQVQSYLNARPQRSLLSPGYLRSREFWYGPGMGLIGGVVGGILRYLVAGR